MATTAAHRALLSGLIVCAGCGRPMVPTTRSGVRTYRCRRHHRRGECPEPAHVGAWIEPYVVDVAAEVMRGRGYRATRSDRHLAEAERELENAEAARDDLATATAGMAREDIVAGMRAHAERVRDARRAFAEARLAAGDLPDARSWAKVWRWTDVDGRRRLLRGALGAVVVRKGRGIDPDRVRVLAAGAVVEPDVPVDIDRLPDDLVVA